MGYDFGIVDFEIKCKDENEAAELREQLEQRFPPEAYYLRFSGYKDVAVSCSCYDPGYSINDELEELIDFIGPEREVTGRAKLEDGSDITYVSVIEWIEGLPASEINLIEEVAEWITKYTPDQIQQLKEYAEKNFGAGHDN